MRYLAALILSTVCASAQVTFNVPSPSHPTIQSAINAAADGDIVQLAAGVFSEPLAINQKSITLRGAGKDLTQLDGLPRGVALIVCSTIGSAPQVTIEDLEITMLAPPVYQLLAIFWSGTAGRLKLGNVRIKDWKGQLYLGLGELEIEDSDFINCTAQDDFGRFGSFMGGFPFLSVKRSNFRNVTIGLDPTATPEAPTGALFAGSAWGATFEDCLFEGHRGGQLFGDYASVNRCVIRDCISLRSAVNIGYSATCALIECSGLTDSLIVNCETELGSVVDLQGSTITSRTTLAANRARSPQLGIIRHLGSASLAVFESVLVSGNDDDRIELSFETGVITYDFRNCLLGASWYTVPSYFSNGPFAAPVVNQTNRMVGLAAAFRDPSNGDFSLLPGSPGVDAGSPSASLPATDLAGNPRLVAAAPDIGCFETQNLDPGPAFAGTTSTQDLLAFNGTNGGTQRSVTIDAGTTCTLSVAEPSPGASAAFILWGYLGVPRATDAFAIPFAGGQIAFLPHLLDVSNPQLFTMTNNLLAPSSGLLASLPAPWSVTGPAAAFPITMTLQGLIVDGTGPLRITNAITLHAR